MLPVPFSVLILLFYTVPGFSSGQPYTEAGSFWVFLFHYDLRNDPSCLKKKKKKNTQMKTICLNYFFLLALHQVWDRGLHRIKWGFGKLPKNHKCYEQEAAPSWIPCWSVNRRCCVNGDCAFVSRPPRPEGHPTSLLCGGWGWEWGGYCIIALA